MYSRSLDYGQNPYSGLPYGESSAYNNGSFNMPTLGPMSFSNQQAYPYSFHKLPPPRES